jgi:hypothetical protein
VYVPELKHVDSELKTSSYLSSDIQFCFHFNIETYSYWVQPNNILLREDTIYHFPFLFNEDVTPWEAGNRFVLSESLSLKYLGGNTSDLRKRASRLLDYKIFCERNGHNIFNLSARRMYNRPPYLYYNFLDNTGQLASENINQRTGIVYDFYKFLSEEYGNAVELERVDNVEKITIYFQTKWGNFSKEVTKRAQTKRTTSEPSPIETGYVRDEGEDLRPLQKDQREELYKLIRSDSFDVDERLFVLSAVGTGARKQTIFTMRMGSLDAFEKDKIRKDGTYALSAGPNTPIDTKFDVSQTLYFESWLAEEIKVYARSSIAKKRRNLFKQKWSEQFPALPQLDDDDIYLFLSEQGQAHYIAKSDPRYPRIKTPATGKRADTLKKKILRLASEYFPIDFTFHWLRATFGLIYFEYQQPLIDKGLKTFTEVLNDTRRRMHHKNMETTENYLKLFLNIDEKIAAQELYEDHIFNMLGAEYGVDIDSSKAASK